jgi:hypothetical protein
MDHTAFSTRSTRLDADSKRSLHVRLGLALVCSLTLLAPAVASAAPTYDTFQNAKSIDYNVLVEDNNASASEQTNEGYTVKAAAEDKCVDASTNRSSLNSQTLWYKIVGTGRKLYVGFDNAAFDPFLGIFEGGGLPENHLGCDDDRSLTDDLPNTLTWPSVKGRTYYIQVGACYSTLDTASCDGLDGGDFAIYALTDPPENDAKANAEPIQEGTQLDRDNLSATLDAPTETHDCGTANYGNTVWFKFTAPRAGQAVFTSAGIDTVMSVYRADSGARVGCHDDSNRAAASRVSVPVSSGDYLIQVGGYDNGTRVVEGRFTIGAEFTGSNDLDGDGSSPPADCDDGNGTIHPGAPEVFDNGRDENCNGMADDPNPDRDKDGSPRPADCEDGNPAVRPGKPEIPQNGHDDDCVGGDAPYPELNVQIYRDIDIYREYWIIKKLTLRKLAKGSTATVRCRGKGCPYRKHVYKTHSKRRFELSGAFRGRKIRKGVVIDVRVTLPGSIGKQFMTKFTRLTQASVKQERCLPPGSNKPRKCA